MNVKLNEFKELNFDKSYVKRQSQNYRDTLMCKFVKIQTLQGIIISLCVSEVNS